MAENFFDKVYSLGNEIETRDFYDKWSDQYDKDVTAQGYATPARVARALAKAMTDKAAPILDFGCGTGLSGDALQNAGFTTLDGVDPSGEMLEGARARGIYRNLTRIEPGADVPKGYAAIAAIGVIGCGAAPVTVLDQIVEALEPGAFFTLSFNEHALEEPAFETALLAQVEQSRLTLLSQEDGPHLPGLGTWSRVYVLKRQ